MEPLTILVLQIAFALFGYGNMIYLITKNKGDSKEHDPVIWIFLAFLHLIVSYNIHQSQGEYHLSAIMAVGSCVMAVVTLFYSHYERTSQKNSIYGFLFSLILFAVFLCIVLPLSLFTTIVVNLGLFILSAIQIYSFAQYEGKNPVLSWTSFFFMSMTSLVLHSNYEVEYIMQPVISGVGNAAFIFIPLLSTLFVRVRSFQRISFSQVHIDKHEVNYKVREYISEFLLFWNHEISKIVSKNEEKEHNLISEMMENFVLSTEGSHETENETVDIFCIHPKDIYKKSDRCTSVEHFIKYAALKNYKSLSYWQFFCLIYLYPNSVREKVIHAKHRGYHVVINLRYFTKKKRDEKLFIIMEKEGFLALEEYKDEINPLKVKIITYRYIQ